MGIIEMLSGTTEIKTLRDVLIDELKDIYSAENQLTKALPKMEKKASNAKLKAAFKSHLEETKQQIERLKIIGTQLGISLSGKTCKAMQGLVEEGDEVISEESPNPALIDSLLIGAAQRVEHYEIAAYGTARAFAQQLGETKVVKLLDATIKEEGAADKKLTMISEKDILPAAYKAEASQAKSVSGTPRTIAKATKVSVKKPTLAKNKSAAVSSKTISSSKSKMKKPSTKAMM